MSVSWALEAGRYSGGRCVPNPHRCSPCYPGSPQQRGCKPHGSFGRCQCPSPGSLFRCSCSASHPSSLHWSMLSFLAWKSPVFLVHNAWLADLSQLQKDALEKIGCNKIFTDTASGVSTERKGFFIVAASSLSKNRVPIRTSISLRRITSWEVESCYS